MPRIPVAMLWFGVLSGIPAESAAQIPYSPTIDLSGRYDITRGTGPGGQGEYSGQVAVSKVKGCYQVTWTLEGGTTYDGVGMLLGESFFAVAYAEATRTGYGVVAYLANKKSGVAFNGAWCQPDGGRGDESLSPPAALAGTHPLAGGNGSYTGSLEVTKAGGFTDATTPWVPLRLAWRTSQGDYAGYGIGFGDQLAVAIWGLSEGGGVVLYTIEPDGLKGEWATIGAAGPGVENLKRASGSGKSAQ